MLKFHPLLGHAYHGSGDQATAMSDILVVSTLLGFVIMIAITERNPLKRPILLGFVVAMACALVYLVRLATNIGVRFDAVPTTILCASGVAVGAAMGLVTRWLRKRFW